MFVFKIIFPEIIEGYSFTEDKLPRGITTNYRESNRNRGTTVHTLGGKAEAEVARTDERVGSMCTLGRTY